jgi:hypothetical protein
MTTWRSAMLGLLAVGLAACGAPAAPPLENAAPRPASPAFDPWTAVEAGATYRLRNDVADEDLDIRVARIEPTAAGRVIRLEWNQRADRPGAEPSRWEAPVTLESDAITVVFQSTSVRFPRVAEWQSHDGKHWVHQDGGALCYAQGLGDGPIEEGLECGECMDMICLRPGAGVVRAAVWELVGGGIFERR